MTAEKTGPETIRPQPRLAQGREHVVATVDEIPSGTHKLVPIGRHGVGAYNVDGTFYAIANYCPHQGGPLCSGRVRGRMKSALETAIYNAAPDLNELDIEEPPPPSAFVPLTTLQGYHHGP